MGISRDKWHKRRATGGKQARWRKKRKFELGRPPANTKLGNKRIRVVRVRGGNKKYRALRLDTGNFSWGSESVTRKTRIMDVVYNASNNLELVRTKTLVKGCIIQIDATPFRQWYETHYGVQILKKKKTRAQTSEKDSKTATKVSKKSDKSTDKIEKKSEKKSEKKLDTKTIKKVATTRDKTIKKEKEKPSGHVLYKLSRRRTNAAIEQQLEDQMNAGRILASISSRPGQCGRADGYILEGKELDFYQKKLKSKRA